MSEAKCPCCWKPSIFSGINNSTPLYCQECCTINNTTPGGVRISDCVLPAEFVTPDNQPNPYVWGGGVATPVIVGIVPCKDCKRLVPMAALKDHLLKCWWWRVRTSWLDWFGRYGRLHRAWLCLLKEDAE